MGRSRRKDGLPEGLRPLSAVGLPGGWGEFWYGSGEVVSESTSFSREKVYLLHPLLERAILRSESGETMFWDGTSSLQTLAEDLVFQEVAREVSQLYHSWLGSLGRDTLQEALEKYSKDYLGSVWSEILASNWEDIREGTLLRRLLLLSEQSRLDMIASMPEDSYGIVFYSPREEIEADPGSARLELQASRLYRYQ